MSQRRPIYPKGDQYLSPCFREQDLGGQETINCLPMDIIVSFAPKLSPAHWPLVVREQLLVVSVQLGARRQPTRCAAVWGGPRRSDALRVRRPSSPRPRRSRGSSLAARAQRGTCWWAAPRRQAVLSQPNEPEPAVGAVQQGRNRRTCWHAGPAEVAAATPQLAATVAAAILQAAAAAVLLALAAAAVALSELAVRRHHAAGRRRG